MYLKTTIKSLAFISLSVLIFQACATVNGAAGSTRTYSESYEAVKKMVNKAINQTKLTIEDMAEQPEKQLAVFKVSVNQAVGKTHMTQEEGEVRVQKLPNGIVKVEVVNPEYHFTVPNHQKENYQRILMPVFDEMMEPRGTSKGAGS